MYLHIHAQSLGRIFEVLPEEIEDVELIVEDVVSNVLLELFDEVAVDEVTVRFTPSSLTDRQACSIEIQAQCAFDSYALHPSTKEQMENTVRTNMSSLLKEVFGPVTVDSVIVQPNSITILPDMPL